MLFKFLDPNVKHPSHSRLQGSSQSFQSPWGYSSWVTSFGLTTIESLKNTLTSESASFSYNIEGESGCQISPITLLPCWRSIMAPRKGTETVMQWKAKWIKEGRVIDSFAHTTAFNLNYLIVTLHPLILGSLILCLPPPFSFRLRNDVSLGNFQNHLCYFVSGRQHRWVFEGLCINASNRGVPLSWVLSHETNQIKKRKHCQGWPRQMRWIQ